MTQSEALDNLIESVEAGDPGKCAFWKVWEPESKDGQIAFIADRAMRGSLDAAKALHKALLPGCSQYSIVTDPLCLKVVVVWWPHGLSDGREARGEAWSEDDPARAWVIATLKAYRAGL